MKKLIFLAGLILSCISYSQVTPDTTGTDNPIEINDTLTGEPGDIPVNDSINIPDEEFEHSGHEFPDSLSRLFDSLAMADTMVMKKHHIVEMMPHSFSQNLPMSRDGSGTSWLPDDSPMEGFMRHHGRWNYMIMWNIFPRITWQNVNNRLKRGDRATGAPNWLMVHATSKRNSKVLWTWGAMISLDPFTEGGEGYPLLMQTGETWRSARLIDRQHPHDAVSGLYAGYTRNFSPATDLTFYVGFPGEPALGPPAYLHRPAAMYLADAPLGHHWQDATHTSFGVLTAGFRTGKLKWEGSWFNGHEPDERRWLYEPFELNSYSGRVSFNPNARYSIQVSAGKLRSPEALEPGVDVDRITASFIGVRNGLAGNTVNYSVVYGANRAHGKFTYSYLLEASYKTGRMNFAGRAEYVQKFAEDLLISYLEEEVVVSVRQVTFAPSYDVLITNHSIISAGAGVQFYYTDSDLERVYGEHPVGLQIFLRLHPRPASHHFETD